jgi:hypothetical protein
MQIFGLRSNEQLTDLIWAVIIKGLRKRSAVVGGVLRARNPVTTILIHSEMTNARPGRLRNPDCVTMTQEPRVVVCHSSQGG